MRLMFPLAPTGIRELDKLVVTNLIGTTESDRRFAQSCSSFVTAFITLSVSTLVDGYM